MLTRVFRQTRQVKLPKDSEVAQETYRRHFSGKSLPNAMRRTRLARLLQKLRAIRHSSS